MSVKSRFLKYVKFDTQSDPNSETYPSTLKQLELLKELKNELEEVGASNVEMDEHGYVTASIPSNTEKKVPVIAFLAHVDTADEVTGENVNPIVHEDYQGGDIKLPKEDQIITVEKSPYLKNLIGHDIITTDGSTLLGADDKSGVAVIMDACEYLINHPEIKHGEIKIAFNPDEEVGGGTKFFDTKKFGADFGYTLDASDRGEIQDENFSADSAKVIFKCKSIHPGYSYKKMINAIKVATRFIELLPKDKMSPETTKDKEEFIHPLEIQGGSEEAEVKFIIRDFDTSNLRNLEQLIEVFAKKATEEFPGAQFEMTTKEQYRNMKDIISKDMRVVDYAGEAMERIGIKVINGYMRGGTDGAMLTYKGLPCPNLFTGMQNYHGKLEYISVQDMEASVKTIVEIVKVWEEKG